MMDFDIKNLVPRYLWNDKNGHAMAKAMEAGLRYFLGSVQDGLDTWGNVDKMPEWRLDELAWEYNIPYDDTAGLDIKRAWIREVYSLSGLWGTPEGILRYMAAYFDDAAMEEYWEYGGDPFHFRMRFPDSWTPEKIAWANKAIATVKNVRSVLDGYTFKGRWPHSLFAGCALYTHEAATYQIPAVAIENDWYIDENGDMLLDEDGILLIVE